MAGKTTANQIGEAVGMILGVVLLVVGSLVILFGSVAAVAAAIGLFVRVFRWAAGL